MKKYNKGRLLQLISLLCALTVICAVVPFGFLAYAEQASDPIVYTNTFEEAKVQSIYSQHRMNALNYDVVEAADGNRVLRYIGAEHASDTYNNNLVCAFYNPNKLNSGTWEFEWEIGANSTALYRVSFRYMVKSLASDCSGFSIYIGTSNCQNSYTNVMSHALATNVTQTGDWKEVSVIVNTSFNSNWQNNALGIILYNCRGEVWFDDIVVEDYTETNALYVTFNTNGGVTIDDCLINSETELPTAVRGSEEFVGWYLDSGFEKEFDFNTYDRSANGHKITLYACFDDSNAGSVIYTDTFEENYIPTIYAGAKKYNSFNFIKDSEENTVLKYSLKYGDDYDYAPNYCALYDNTNKKALSTGKRQALYRISFRYKVESLAEDSGCISVSLSSMHSENCWAGTNLSSKKLIDCVVSDEWKEVTEYAVIDTQNADWQHQGLGLALSGRGVMFLDDIVVEDLTDTKALLMSFDTCGGEPIDSKVFFPDEELPIPFYDEEVFVRWHTDSELTVAFSFDTYDRAENGFEVTLYARYKSSGFEIIDPLIYTDTFEENYVDSLYSGQNKSDTFVVEEKNINKVLKYNKPSSADGWDAVLLYDNSNGELLNVKPEKRIYHIAFRYKAESIGTDTDALTVGLGLSDTQSFSDFDSIKTELMSIGVTDSWHEFGTNIEIDCSDAQQQVLALAVKGSGVVLFDDIVIKDYTDTNAILVNFETNGGNLISSIIAEKKSDIPTPSKNGTSFMGWFTDNKFSKYFEFYEYDRTQSGKSLTLYAKFNEFLGGKQPVKYLNDFEGKYLNSVYVERTKYNAFDIARLPGGNMAMQYKMTVGEDYDYSVNFCSLYNDIKETVLSNDERLAFFRISFRYKVASLAADCDRINFAITSMHTGNCWASGVFDTVEVASSGVTDGWAYCEQYVAIDTRDTHWQERGLGIRMSGRGLAYIDDVHIEDYTDADLNGFFLITSGGDTLAPLLGDVGTTVQIPTSVSKPRSEFEGWCIDNRCTKDYEGDSTITEGLTRLYVKWKQETIEYEKFQPKLKEKENYTYRAVYKGGVLGLSENDVADSDKTEEDVENYEKKQVVRRKKIIRRVSGNGDVNIPLVIGFSIGGAVIVAAGVVTIILIRRKKRRLTK